MTNLTSNQCGVKGCKNTRDSGEFVGPFCAPCDHDLRTGNFEFGTSIVYEQAREIERAKRIMHRAISWLQIKEAAFTTHKGPAIIEEMQRYVGDLPDETSDGWKRLHRAIASWSAHPSCGPTGRPDITALNKILAANNPFDNSPEEPSEQPPVETGLRTGELAQLRRIDSAARFYVDSVKPGSGLAWENLMNALFDGRPEKSP